MVKLIRRGDVFLVNFRPAREDEASDVRPAVVVTNNLANQAGTTIVVVPITSNTEKVYPFQVHLPVERSGLNQDSKIQVEQLRSISVRQLGRRLSHLPEDLMEELNRKIKLHLALT